MLINLFLNYSLRKKNNKTPSTRLSYYFHNKLNYQYKFKNLKFFKKWNAGRNDLGAIVARTKSSLKTKHSLFRINYNLRYIKIGFIASFQFIPFKNKLLSLIFFASGAVSYYLSSESHKLFHFINIYTWFSPRNPKFKNSIKMLVLLHKLTFISNLEIYPNKGSQYVRSPGTQAKIIKFDHPNRTALIILPSKVKKFFSYYSFVLLGRIAMSLHFKATQPKAGYWKIFGIKSIVRGVAKNPVDHPHGGRTKAIRYQRTPWGKTTKFK